jgi:hypothetical protein
MCQSANASKSGGMLGASQPGRIQSKMVLTVHRGVGSSAIVTVDMAKKAQTISRPDLIMRIGSRRKWTEQLC